MIVRVESRTDVLDFVGLPWSPYRQTPGWTPPSRTSVLRFHDPERGPFFTCGSAQSFLERDGRCVRGRITAHVYHAYTAYHGTSVGGFGFLNAEPKQSVVIPLVDAAGDWLRCQGGRSVWGPIEFCLDDRVGLRIEGFERSCR